MLRTFSIDVSQEGAVLNGRAHSSAMIFAAERNAGESVRAALAEKVAAQTAPLVADVRQRIQEALLRCMRITEESPFTFSEQGVTVTIRPTRFPGCMDQVGFDLQTVASGGHGWGN